MLNKPTPNEKLAWGLTCAASVALVLVLLFSSVFFFATYKPFYTMEFEKNDIAQNIGVSERTLDEITQGIFDYLTGGRDNLSIRAEIDGGEREVFNDKEKSHMDDVLALFRLMSLALWICFAVFAVFFLAAWFLTRKELRVYRACRAIICTVSLTLIVLMLAVVYVITDFDRAFVMFHHIVFTNDLWLLDPATDILIQIVPIDFFMDIAAAICAAFLGACVLVMLACGLAVTVSSRRLREGYARQEPERPDAEQIFESMNITDDSAVPEATRSLIEGKTEGKIEEKTEPLPGQPVTGGHIRPRRAEVLPPPPRPQIKAPAPERAKPERPAPTAKELRERLEKLNNGL